MSNTTRHIAAALGWLIALPLVAVALFALGALPGSELHSTVVSVVWGSGLVAVFSSWALRDAPSHGKSRNVALGFTAAWFLVFFFAVFPYLFVTRGVRSGLVASLRFLSLCLGFAILWFGVPAVFSRLF
ncbi:hypothetical protein V4F39_16465 [Aquincola sp. MAHUQ-54]|uniref:Transmembrane protein n=1 Tax=Aquincola agrisoli TaxID=3119538 RepID=A0AAW9Q8Z4_9BURK